MAEQSSNTGLIIILLVLVAVVVGIVYMSTPTPEPTEIPSTPTPDPTVAQDPTPATQPTTNSRPDPVQPAIPLRSNPPKSAKVDGKCQNGSVWNNLRTVKACLGPCPAGTQLRGTVCWRD